MKPITACHVCSSATLEGVEHYETFTRVTSDCKPWPRGGKLGICRNCGCVQAVTDQVWQQEATEIYKNYSIWHQGGGAEQSVFDPSGQATARSRRILERLLGEIRLPSCGRLLDIGCGNGSLLSTASQLLPEWSLVGTEFDGRYRDRIEAIPRVERLHTGPLEQIDGRFDLVTLSHVLEHWISPVKLLRLIESLLNPQGYLLIQVPDYTENPFELLVADHCSHFSSPSLAQVVRRSDYAVRIMTTQWVPREITLVAQRGVSMPFLFSEIPYPWSAVVRALSWLDALRARARQCPDQRRLGIFGTSIAGTWLYGEIPERVSFFVDEDVQRVGKTHLGLPIVLPRQVRENSLVLVALPDSIAPSLAARLRQEAPPAVEYQTSDAA